MLGTLGKLATIGNNKTNAVTLNINKELRRYIVEGIVINIVRDLTYTRQNFVQISG